MRRHRKTYTPSRYLHIADSFAPVFPCSANEALLVDTGHRFLPGLSKVVGLKNVGTKIVHRIAVDGSIGRTCIKVRSLNQRNGAPLRDRRWSDILPRLAHRCV